VLLFLAGLAALLWTFAQVGLAELAHALSNVRGAGWTVLLFYPVVSFWDAWGWRYVFPPAWRKMRIVDLFLVRLAGEAVNSTTPFLDAGGEPLKIALLHRRFGLDKPSAASATVLAKAFLFFSEVAFWACGLVPALVFAPASLGWKWALSIFCVAATLLSLGVALLQSKGFFSFFLRLVGRVAPHSKLAERFRAPFEAVDASMAAVYSGNATAPAAAFALHFTGWVAGGVETYLMFHVLGVPVSPVEALTLEALLQLTRTASCVIPGNIGVQEAGMAFYAGWFGMSPSYGVALSLLKRTRQLLWSLIGFAVWGAYEYQLARRESRGI